MNDKPLVSILMTAYNREKYISDAIQSVLENSFQNFELIIVDDNSFDETLMIAKKYASIDSRIKVFSNQQNLGDYPNRNIAASYAKGDFILYVDSDDKLHKYTIDKIFYENKICEEMNFGMYWLHSNEKFILKGLTALRMHFFKKQFLFMGPGGTIIRRKFFNEIGGYPTGYGPANDMYFNLKACCYSDLHLFPFQFIFYRQHEAQESNNKFSYIYNNYLYLNDACKFLKMGLTNKELKYLLKKNKRRLIVNLFSYFLETLSLKKIHFALMKTKFTTKDFIEGIFN